MIWALLCLVNSCAGWYYVYLHATSAIVYNSDERYIPYIVISGFALLVASTGLSLYKKF